jgi:hypothetical protein
MKGSTTQVNISNLFMKFYQPVHMAYLNGISKNIELIIVENVRESKRMYEIPPTAKKLRRQTEIIRLQRRPKIIYEVPSSINALPPPDSTTINEIMLVELFDQYETRPFRNNRRDGDRKVENLERKHVQYNEYTS